MSEKICPNCGNKTSSKYCSSCGYDMSKVKEPQSLKVENAETTIPVNKVSKDNMKNIIIIGLAVVVVVLGVFMVINMNSTPGIIADEETGEVAEDVALEENQGKSLPGGKYIVGEDISAGKYFLEYKTELSEDDYWSNDYFYIIRNGSEGTEETLGGTKFDERFGSVDYSDAKKGKSFFVNLKDGDTINVESGFGEWTY